MSHKDSNIPQKHKHRKLSKSKLRKEFDVPRRSSARIITVCAILGLGIIVYLVVTGAHFGGNM